MIYQAGEKEEYDEEINDVERGCLYNKRTVS